MAWNSFHIPTASNFVEHLIMAADILRVPKSIEGVVVECGCFKGGSTANLSLVCALVGRKLLVFDSFCGLPQPQSSDREHVILSKRELDTYEKGAWSGGIDEVRANVSRFGRVDICEFWSGYFDNSLPALHSAIVFAFVDADLRESVKTCLVYLWPLLQKNCRLYTHEAQHQSVSELFYDPTIWNGKKPPGLIGAGTGLGLIPRLGPFTSAIGYAIKDPDVSAFHVSVENG